MAKKVNKQFLLQCAVALSGSITVAGYGATISWSSPAIPHLMSGKSEISITKDQSSWITSVSALGLIIGYLINPLFIDQIGRKWTLILFALPQIASWLLIILAKNYMNLFIARVIGGMGYGGGLCAMTVYMSEIGNKQNKGIFLVLIRLSMGIGSMWTMILGAYFTYQQMNLVLLITPIIFVAIFLFMPDSSYFLEINKRKEAEEFKEMKLVSSGKTEEKELGSNFGQESRLYCGEEVILDSKEEKEKEEAALNSKGKSTLHSEEGARLNYKEESKFCFILKESSLWKLFAVLNNRKALTIVQTTGVTIVFSGQAAILSFGQQILTYKGAVMNPEKAMALLAGLNVLACLISTQIIERVKRKSLLLFSGITCTISLGLVGLFFCLLENKIDISYIGWLPIFGLSVWDMTFCVGHSNLFYIYQGELFKNEVKSIAVSMVKLTLIGLIFISIFKFQTILEIISMHWVFWFFSICCAFGSIAIYCMVPETQGKSLEEIQEEIKRKDFFSECKIS